MTPEDAAEFMEAHGQAGQSWWRMSALGLRLGVPEALGIDQAEYGRRLGGYFKLPIDERRDAVAELASDGMTQRQIADVLGVGPATVNRDLTAVPNGTAGDAQAADHLDKPVADVPSGTPASATLVAEEPTEREPLEEPPPPLEESMAKLDQAATLTDVLQAERAEREAVEQTSTAEMSELRDACRRLLDVLIVIDHLPAHEQTEAEDWLRELKKELERHA